MGPAGTTEQGGAVERATSVDKEAKGLADRLVGTLGLVDLIVGGLLLYGVWRTAHGAESAVDRLAKQFPSTGILFVDVGLLACAAALTGKLVSLGVAVVMAIVNLILGWFTSAKRELEREVSRFQARSGRPEPIGKVNALELAATYIFEDSASAGQRLERVRTEARLAHAASLVGAVYVWYLRSAGVVEWWCWLFVVAFVGLGVLQQLDYIAGARLGLATAGSVAVALPTRKPVTVRRDPRARQRGSKKRRGTG